MRATCLTIVLTYLAACASNQKPQQLAGMNETFTHGNNGEISTFELTATRTYADEAFTLNKREINSTRKQAIHILNWHLENTLICDNGYLLTQQTISAALVKLRGECL